MWLNCHHGLMDEQGRPVLYSIVTGAAVARDVGRLVDIARGEEWEVCVISSPDGRKFIDVDELERRTGRAVRSEYSLPGVRESLPAADGMIVAPITSNSLAKWAAGISDTLPLGLLVEAVGLRIPVVAVPFVNRALRSFPPVDEAVRKLTGWGVTVVENSGPHEPGTGGERMKEFPWEEAWGALGSHPWR